MDEDAVTSENECNNKPDLSPEKSLPANSNESTDDEDREDSKPPPIDSSSHVYFKVII